MNFTLAKNFTSTALALLITTNCSAGFLARTVRRGTGIYLAHQAWKSAPETHKARENFSQEIAKIREQVAKELKEPNKKDSTLPVCEETIAVGARVFTEVQGYLGQKYIARSYTPKPAPKTGQTPETFQEAVSELKSATEKIGEKVTEIAKETISAVLPQETSGEILCKNGWVLTKNFAKIAAAGLLVVKG